VGAFSEMILEVVRPTELHLIDPWVFIPDVPYAWEGGRLASGQQVMDEVYEEVVRRFAARPEVVIHRATSAEAAAEFAPESLDWVHIDGDHRYEFVRADLEAYLPLVKPSGFLAGDDYLWGVDQDLPVKTAVDEFVAAGWAEVVSIDDGQYILRRRR
jgi:Methyltransferase domain